jgi:hypothetical protein
MLRFFGSRTAAIGIQNVPINTLISSSFRIRGRVAWRRSPRPTRRLEAHEPDITRGRSPGPLAA